MVTAIISAIVALAGAGLSYANTQGAQSEARQLNQQEINVEQQQNAFSNQAKSREMNMRGAGNVLTANSNELQQVADVLNKNADLKRQVMGNWGK